MRFAQVLEPVQVARAIVQSYPWAPDTMAVAAVVAAEGGDTEALTHLRADCSGGPGAYVQPRHNSLGKRCAHSYLMGGGSCVHIVWVFWAALELSCSSDNCKVIWLS
jgi:hypothetical protein